MPKINILVSFLICTFVAPSFALKYFDIAHNFQPQRGNKKLECFIKSDNTWCCPHPDAIRAVLTYRKDLKDKSIFKQHKIIYMSEEEYKNSNNWLENKCGIPGSPNKSDF